MNKKNEDDAKYEESECMTENDDMTENDNDQDKNEDDIEDYYDRESAKIKIKVKLAKNLTIDPKIMAFIKSLSYDGFILAGNSVANMIENVPIRGDLDFWVTDEKKYLQTLEEFSQKNPITYDIYPSMIEMKIPDLPIINLIFSGMSAENTAKSFDFDYCRCYYTNKTGPIGSKESLDSIKTKTICNEICYGDIRPARIMKAIRYGYKFNCRFWNYNSELIKDSKPKKCDKCDQYDQECHRSRTNEHMCTINIDDLNLLEFEQQIIDPKIPDPENIEQSIDYLKKLFKIYRGSRKNTICLPRLFSFPLEKYHLVKQYVEKIIMLNPVRDGNYMDIILSKELTKNHDFYNSSFWLKNGGYDLNDIDEDEDIFHYDPQDLESTGPCKTKDGKIINEKIIYLNENKTAYLKVEYLPHSLIKYGEDNYEKMFNLHPQDKHKIIMGKEEKSVHRWQQSYLKTPPHTEELLENRSYMYSGYDMTKNNDELPKYFQKYYDFMVQKNKAYNQVVVNWYQDGNDFIAYHANCESGMIPDAEIATISLYGIIDDEDSSLYRTFSVIPKDTNVDHLYEKVNILARNGTIITMCGATQKDFKHGIEKEDQWVQSMISICFRQLI